MFLRLEGSPKTSEQFANLPVIEPCINVSCTSSPEASRYILDSFGTSYWTRQDIADTSSNSNRGSNLSANYWSYSTVNINRIHRDLKILPDVLRKQHRNDTLDNISYRTEKKVKIWTRLSFSNISWAINQRQVVVYVCPRFLFKDKL